jgi:CDP-diacylglycerol---glycerol-3-phosphate 3-phosphatidyltransferase
MITKAIGVGSRWLLDKIVGALAATGINPNVLTFIGLVVNFWAAALFATGHMALYLGLLVYYAVNGRTSYVILAAVATAGSVMVSYARARAESLIPLCKVGFMERPERMVLLIIGGLFDRMAAVLWVISVVSTLTVIHRIVFTWQETRAGRTLPGIRLSL